MSADRPAALRIDMQAALAKAGRKLNWFEMGPSLQTREVAAEPALWGDATLSRKDIQASYHIAVVVDDALQGVTDVVRGEDLFAATGLHRLLQVLLDLPAPAYCHHLLLRDASGQKLSKSVRSKSLRSLRQDGVSAAALRQKLLSNLRHHALIYQELLGYGHIGQIDVRGENSLGFREKITGFDETNAKSR
jgi:glutamyl-Q tRNA(Asp) synthetase